MRLFSYVFAAAMLAAALTGCQASPKESATLAELLKKGEWIDLTHEFSDKTIYWPNNPAGFELDTQFNGITPGGFFYSSNAYCSPEHSGTHIDAPVHFAEGKWSLEQIPVAQLAGEVVIVDVSEKALTDPDYQVTVQDIEAWETENGKIPDDVFLFIRTGWGRFYNDPAKYLGTAEKGEQAIPHLHFPSVHPDLATWLVKNRKLKALGIDTPSVDYGQSKDFKTHQILYAQNIPGFENLANLDALPLKGAIIFAFPMKIKNGTGGPLRAVAWVEKDK